MDRLAIAEQQWIDPVTDNQEVTEFRLYPQPSRREPDARGSYQIYLPPSYEFGGRFPVIYWLHGGFGDSRQGLPVVHRIEAAITAGLMAPAIVVLPQALPVGWYIDSKDGARPVEQVMVNDLVPHIDATYRTIPEPDARTLEGFSMGGYGALHLGFKYPRLFGRVSAIGPSILRDMSQEPEERIGNTFFGDHDYYAAVSPWTLMLANAPELRASSRIRLLTGTGDGRLVPTVREFASSLCSLDIPHEFHEVTGAGHDPAEVIDGMGDPYFTFWSPPPAG